MPQKLLIPLLSFLALFLSSAAYSAMAQTTTSAGCGNYYQGASGAAPSGYGSSQNFFLGGQDIAVDCTAQDVNVGTGSNLEYVYKDGYIYLNNVWQKVTLSPINSPLVSGTWYNGSAKIMLPQADYSNWTFIAAYTCTYVNNSWKCGCADSACATSNWQIQAVRMPAQSTPIPGQLRTGTITGTATIGPTTPVCVAGSSCTRGYQTTLLLKDANGSTVNMITTNADGTFTVSSVLPRTYTISVPASSSIYPRFTGTDPSTITVVAGQTATVSVSFDSGIR